MKKGSWYDFISNVHSVAGGVSFPWRWLRYAGAIGIDHPRASEPTTKVGTNAVPRNGKPRFTSQHENRRSKDAHHFSGGRWVQVLYALTDFLLVCIDGLIAFSFRFLPSSPERILHWSRISSELGFSVNRYAAFFLLYGSLTLLFCQSQSLYRTVRTRTATQESFAILKAVTLSTLLLSAFIYFSGVKIVSRLVIACAGALNVITFAAWRLVKRRVVLGRAERGIGARNAVIVGAGRVGQALSEYLTENKQLGYQFKGFLDANHSGQPKLLGKIEDLARISRLEFIDEVLITIPSERELVKKVTAEARLLRLNVKVVPELYDGLGWDAPIQYVGDFPVMELHWEPIPGLGLFLKRVIDILGAGMSLVVLSPVLVATAIAIRLDSPGPALYCSQRVGKKGRRFSCYKFRSMVVKADEMKDHLRHLNERQGPTFKIASDPRITGLGKFLRKYSLDEIPQLWNVLKGDMSLVGPRPHPVDDYEQYSLEHLRRLDVKPGITGLWQVTARQDPSFETNMKLDLEYIENWNISLDMGILAKTLLEIAGGSGT